MYFEDNKHRFSKWLHKIIHVKTKPLGENFWDRELYKDIVKDNTLSTQDDTTWKTWERESQQRHSILDGLAGFENDDIVMISDVDEIPDYKFIRDDYKEPITFKMWLFRYSLDYMVNHQCDWDGTVLTTVGDAYKKSPNKIRDGRYFNKKIENSGWHFTKFGDETSIRMMYSNYSHHKDFNYEEIIKNKTQHGSSEKLLTRLESVYIPTELE
jgi:beta-1,4-mannosyl-glycoprotein beta-1,4-N-acetylglucosaminyltransferase